MYNIDLLISAIGSAETVKQLVGNIIMSRGYLYGEKTAIATQCTATGTDIVVFGTHPQGGEFVMTSFITVEVHPAADATEWPKMDDQDQPVKLVCLGLPIGGIHGAQLLAALSEEIDGTTKGDILAQLLGYDTWAVIRHGNVPEVSRPTVTTKVYTGSLRYSFRNNFEVSVFAHSLSSDEPETTGGHIYGWNDSGGVSYFVRDIRFDSCDLQNFDDLQSVYASLLSEEATSAIQDLSDLAIKVSANERDRIAADAALLSAFENVAVFGNTVKSIVTSHSEASQYIPRP